MAVSVKDFLDAIRGRYQDEPNKVEVTGRKQMEETILQRDVRTSSMSFYFDIPEFANVCYIHHQVHGLTGDFLTGGGYNIAVQMGGTFGSGNTPFSRDYTGGRTTPSTQPSNSPEGGNLIVYGTNGSDVGSDEGKMVLFLGIPLIHPGKIRLALGIAGSFEEGEGIDSEIVVRWES